MKQFFIPSRSFQGRERSLLSCSPKQIVLISTRILIRLPQYANEGNNIEILSDQARWKETQDHFTIACFSPVFLVRCYSFSSRIKVKLNRFFEKDRECFLKFTANVFETESNSGAAIFLSADHLSEEEFLGRGKMEPEWRKSSQSQGGDSLVQNV